MLKHNYEVELPSVGWILVFPRQKDAGHHATGQIAERPAQQCGQRESDDQCFKESQFPPVDAPEDRKADGQHAPTIYPPTKDAFRGFFPWNISTWQAATPATKIETHEKTSGSVPSTFIRLNITANAVMRIISVPMPNRRGTPTCGRPGARAAVHRRFPGLFESRRSPGHPTTVSPPLAAARKAVMNHRTPKGCLACYRSHQNPMKRSGLQSSPSPAVRCPALCAPGRWWRSAGRQGSQAVRPRAFPIRRHYRVPEIWLLRCPKLILMFAKLRNARIDNPQPKTSPPTIDANRGFLPLKSNT